MKVLFISYAFDSGWTYQENLLPQACIENGHEVLCVASNIGVTKNGKLEKKIYDDDPAYIKRLDTVFTGQLQISVRIRYLKGLYSVMEEYNPDVIFLHSMQTFNLRTLLKYKRRHPDVRIYYNSHTDYYTSGTNWLSMNVLHKIIYRRLLHRYMDVAEKFFYISLDCGKFLWNVYKIPKDKTELMLLGGYVQNWDEINNARESVVKELALHSDSIIFVQAGKIDEKKCLIETLKALKTIEESRFVFLIIGSLSDSIKQEAEKLIEADDRVYYLGWQKDEGLIRYLNAADIYLQPGKGSAILQTALCSSCAVVARNFEDYQILVKENGWLIDKPNQIKECFEDIAKYPEKLRGMCQASHDVAIKMLEQRNLVKKFTE